MAVNSQALGCCLITDRQGWSCLLLCVGVLLPSGAIGSSGCLRLHCMAKPWGWDVQGISSLPSCLPWGWWCLLGSCKHIAGDWRYHWWCWCEDVAAPRGWGTMRTLLGFCSWGQPDPIRPAGHIMVGFILSDALQWFLLVEEGDLPRFGWKGAQRVAPSAR